MAKPIIVPVQPFAENASLVQFGSSITGTPVVTNDIAILQALPAFVDGIGAATINQSSGSVTYHTPNQDEFNGLFNILFETIGQMQQSGGLLDYSITQTYAQNAIVQNPGTTEIYKSLIDGNIGNLLTDNTKWILLGDLTELGTATGALLKTNNLSDLLSISTARTNLGLGTVAIQNTGVVSGTVPLIGTASATTTLAGLIQLATQTQVNTGTDNQAAVTALTLTNTTAVVHSFAIPVNKTANTIYQTTRGGILTGSVQDSNGGFTLLTGPTSGGWTNAAYLRQLNSNFPQTTSLPIPAGWYYASEATWTSNPSPLTFYEFI